MIGFYWLWAFFIFFCYDWLSSATTTLRNLGQVYSQAVGSRPDIRWTREGPSWDDDSYLGYSVAHGEFTGDRESDVAVGMPRGSNLTGKVKVYSNII